MFPGRSQRVTYSHDALRPLDYPCELDGKVVSDHDWIIVDRETEEVVSCSFERKFLTAPQ
jgi:hypothetical protein